MKNYITDTIVIGMFNDVSLEEIGYTAHCKYINGDCHWRVMYNGKCIIGGVSSNKEFATNDCRRAVSIMIANKLIDLSKEANA